MKLKTITKQCLIAILWLLLCSCVQQNIRCSDILQTYNLSTNKLEFVECKKGENQTILETTYKVLGQNAESVEAYLVKKCGMGKLKQTCCGWEGQSGYIQPEKLKQINSDYTIEISM